MKYAIWFVRLVFAAWMLPAGLNHFVPLFPQPLGNEPLSRELFRALFDSHLFDLVKAVELLAGISALTGFYTPLALVMCMPVSFCVWYWDTPLQGWGSLSSIYGWAVLGCNVLLCLSYLDRYRAMLLPLARPRASGSPALVLGGRLIFGAWMVLNGISFFFMPILPASVGHQPLAVELMTALVDSRLFHVAMAIQLVAGALILVGLFVPLALCLIMPISVCAAYWAVILEHEPLGALLALVAVALNAALMLAYLDRYRDMLVRHAVAAGETTASCYEALFVDPRGGTARAAFIAALIPLALAAAFYHWLVFGGSGTYAMLMLLFPAIVLHARRLHDMGWSARPLLIPAVPAAAAIWLHMVQRSTGIERPAIPTALAVCAAVVLWGLIGKSRSEAGRPGEAAAVLGRSLLRRESSGASR